MGGFIASGHDFNRDLAASGASTREQVEQPHGLYVLVCVANLAHVFVVPMVLGAIWLLDGAHLVVCEYGCWFFSVCAIDEALWS